MDKRIYTWGNETGGYQYTRAYIFDNHHDDFASHLKIREEIRKDFPEIPDSEISVGRVQESVYMKNFIYMNFPVPNGTEQPGYRFCGNKWDWS